MVCCADLQTGAIMSKKMPAWFNRECGGRVPGRKDGGVEPQWQGEGDSGKALKEKSAALDDQSTTAGNAAKGLGAASLAGFGTMVKSRSIPRALAGAYTALGAGAGAAGMGARAAIKRQQAAAADKEADKAEGKKRGGKVKKKGDIKLDGPRGNRYPFSRGGR